ncbi:hypothetical protein M0R45_021256 [Rubus argutus]|uniref:Uncharacterized protein n=1 Tax=Rubus argutus TaxID=59490 RepID=A0AAW1XC41_RUBAR
MDLLLGRSLRLVMGFAEQNDSKRPGRVRFTVRHRRPRRSRSPPSKTSKTSAPRNCLSLPPLPRKRPQSSTVSESPTQSSAPGQLALTQPPKDESLTIHCPGIPRDVGRARSSDGPQVHYLAAADSGSKEVDPPPGFIGGDEKVEIGGGEEEVKG